VEQPEILPLHLSKARIGTNDFKFITSGRGIQTDPVHYFQLHGNLNRRGLHVFGSKDHGNPGFLLTSCESSDESQIMSLANGGW